MHQFEHKRIDVTIQCDKPISIDEVTKEQFLQRNLLQIG